MALRGPDPSAIATKSASLRSNSSHQTDTDSTASIESLDTSPNQRTHGDEFKLMGGEDVMNQEIGRAHV